MMPASDTQSNTSQPYKNWLFQDHKAIYDRLMAQAKDTQAYSGQTCDGLNTLCANIQSLNENLMNLIHITQNKKQPYHVRLNAINNMLGLPLAMIENIHQAMTQLHELTPQPSFWSRLTRSHQHPLYQDLTALNKHITRLERVLMSNDSLVHAKLKKKIPPPKDIGDINLTGITKIPINQILDIYSESGMCLGYVKDFAEHFSKKSAFFKSWRKYAFAINKLSKCCNNEPFNQYYYPVTNNIAINQNQQNSPVLSSFDQNDYQKPQPTQSQNPNGEAQTTTTASQQGTTQNLQIQLLIYSTPTSKQDPVDQAIDHAFAHSNQTIGLLINNSNQCGHALGLAYDPEEAILHFIDANTGWYQFNLNQCHNYRASIRQYFSEETKAEEREYFSIWKAYQPDNPQFDIYFNWGSVIKETMWSYFYFSAAYIQSIYQHCYNNIAGSLSISQQISSEASSHTNCHARANINNQATKHWFQTHHSFFNNGLTSLILNRTCRQQLGLT